MSTLTLGKMGSTLAESMAVISAILAAAIIWLLLTDPAVLAGALVQGSAASVAHGVAGIVVSAIARLLGLA